MPVCPPVQHRSSVAPGPSYILPLTPSCAERGCSPRAHAALLEGLQLAGNTLECGVISSDCQLTLEEKECPLCSLYFCSFGLYEAHFAISFSPKLKHILFQNIFIYASYK